jgi:hypothetical protein
LIDNGCDPPLGRASAFTAAVTARQDAIDMADQLFLAIVYDVVRRHWALPDLLPDCIPIT